MHSEWFSGIDILQGGWQHGEKVGYCYPSGLEKTLCKLDIYVPLVTKGLKHKNVHITDVKALKETFLRTPCRPQVGSSIIFTRH
jgi:hypothetical protein